MFRMTNERRNQIKTYRGKLAIRMKARKQLWAEEVKDIASTRKRARKMMRSVLPIRKHLRFNSVGYKY